MTDHDVIAYLLAKAAVAIPGFRGTAADVKEILKEYPAFPTPREALMAFSTDLLFTCTAERMARFFASSGAPVFRYLFTRPPAAFKVPSCFGAPHVSDVLLLFSDSFPKKSLPYVVGDAVEQEIKKSMIESLGRFAHEGSPGSNWPKWTNAEITLQLGNATSSEFLPIYGYRSSVCSMIERLIDPLKPKEPHVIVV